MLVSPISTAAMSFHVPPSVFTLSGPVTGLVMKKKGDYTYRSSLMCPPPLRMLRHDVIAPLPRPMVLLCPSFCMFFPSHLAICFCASQMEVSPQEHDRLVCIKLALTVPFFLILIFVFCLSLSASLPLFVSRFTASSCSLSYLSPPAPVRFSACYSSSHESFCCGYLYRGNVVYDLFGCNGCGASDINEQGINTHYCNCNGGGGGGCVCVCAA